MKRTMKEVLKTQKKLTAIGFYLFGIVGIVNFAALMIHLGNIRFDVGYMFYFAVGIMVFIVCVVGFVTMLWERHRLFCEEEIEDLRDDFEKEIEELRDNMDWLEDMVIRYKDIIAFLCASLFPVGGKIDHKHGNIRGVDA